MRTLVVLLLLIVQATAVFAQNEKCDLIVTSDGNKIEAVISEVSDDEVVYKKISMPRGPNFKIKTANIATIIYRSGDVQVFSHDKSSGGGADQQSGKQSDKCFEFVNEDTDLQEDVIINNLTGEPIDITINGKLRKTGAEVLVLRQTIAPYSENECKTAFNDGDLDHIATFDVCTNGEYSNVCYNEEQSLCIALYKVDFKTSVDISLVEVEKEIDGGFIRRNVKQKINANKMEKLFKFQNNDPDLLMDKLEFFFPAKYQSLPMRKRIRSIDTNVKEDGFAYTNDEEETEELINYMEEWRGDVVLVFSFKNKDKKKKEDVYKAVVLTKSQCDMFISEYEKLKSTEK